MVDPSDADFAAAFDACRSYSRRDGSSQADLRSARAPSPRIASSVGRRADAQGGRARVRGGVATPTARRCSSCTRAPRPRTRPHGRAGARRPLSTRAFPPPRLRRERPASRPGLDRGVRARRALALLDHIGIEHAHVSAIPAAAWSRCSSRSTRRSECARSCWRNRRRAQLDERWHAADARRDGCTARSEHRAGDSPAPWTCG